jgi:hypothetical protein
MHAVAFDTLKLARKLENSGLPAKQAQDMSAAFAETLTEWHSVGNLATKEDVHALKEDLHALNTKLSDTKADLIKWMVGQNIIVLLAIFGLMHGITK